MVSSSKKNPLGEYYTPFELAQYVVNSTFTFFFQHQTLKTLHNITILDLGVGNGAFLLAAGNFLEKNIKRYSLIDSLQLRLDIVKKNLFGVDFNSDIVDSCREKIKSWIIGASFEVLSLNQIDSIQKALNNNIRTGNILLGDITRKKSIKKTRLNLENQLVKKYPEFHWYREFPEIFNGTNPGFDLIFSNPPYVTKEIPPKATQLYRKIYKNQILVNRFNLYHLFFARANDLLKEDSMATFLTANSVLTDRFSTKLRYFILSNFKVVGIVDFVNRRTIFPNILQGTCILVLSKKKLINREYTTHIIRTYDLESLTNDKLEVEYIPIYDLIYFSKFIPSPFSLTFKIFKEMKSNSIMLKNFVKIQSGEIRPADKNIKSFYYKKLPNNSYSSDFDIVLNGKNVHPFKISLQTHRQKKRWYLQPLDPEKELFRKEHSKIPRIVFQRITAREQLRRIVAGIITKEDLEEYGRIWVENSVNYLLFDSSTHSKLFSQDGALGIFNSLLISWYIHQINLTAAIPPADIGLIPIPEISSLNRDEWKHLEKKVIKIRNLLNQYHSSSEILKFLCPICSSNKEISELRSEIDGIVFNLYGISPESKKEVLRQLTVQHNYFNHH